MSLTASIIVCTYNRRETLTKALESIQAMQVPSNLTWELIVVDNNSPDGTGDAVSQFAEKTGISVRYIFEPRAGLSYARNTGIENAKGEILVFTDDDVTVDPLWLANVCEAFASDDCAAIGGKIIPVWPVSKPWWFQDDGPFATPKAIVSFDLGDQVCAASIHPYGANMAFRREVFVEHGKFRVDLGRKQNELEGGEDIEFFERLRNARKRVLYIPAVVVFHPVADERSRPSYFQSWCFHAARSQMRLDGLPQQAVYYLGVPRYLLRSMTVNFVKWLMSVEPKRRFYYKLKVFTIAGAIIEARKYRNRATV